MKQTLLFLTFTLIATLNSWSQPNFPSVEVIEATDTIGCIPFVVEFTSSTPNVVSWSWNFGNGNTSTQQNPTEMYLTQGTYTVTLDVVFQNGNTEHFEKTNYIEVLLSPTINVSVSSLQSCLNSNNIQFYNATLNATQYLWDFGDGNLSSANSPNHHYNSAGNYDVTFFASNAFGCSKDTTISNLVIHPVTQSSVQVNGNTSVCDSSNLFNFVASPSGLDSYSWEFSDGSQLNGATIQHVFNSYGSFDLLLTTVDANGCIDSTNVQDIVETTSGSDDFTVSTTSTCELTNIVFDANATGATSVSWNFGDGVSVTGFSQNHSYQNSGQYDITMITTRPNGCGQTITKPFFIEILPPSNMETHISDSIVCVNEPIIFKVLSTNAQSFQWFFGDGSSSSQPMEIHRYTIPGQYSAQIIYGSGGCLDTMTKVINVPQPIADFQNDVFSNCAPADIQFHNTSTNAVNWEWEFANGTTSIEEHPSVMFNNSGHYSAQLIVEDINGCLDTAFLNNAVVISSNIPTNFNSANFEGCSPLSISFYNYSVGVGHWNWDFGDGQTSSGFAPSHMYTTPGEYIVSLETMDSLGCASEIDTFAIVKVNALEIDSIAIDLNCQTLEASFSVACPECLTGNWNFGDGTSNSLTNASHEYSGQGPYDLMYRGVSSIGCLDMRLFTIDFGDCSYEETGSSSDIGNQENWVDSPDSSAGVPYNGFCNPVTVSIENPRPNAQSWIWHFGDGATGDGLIPSHTYDSIGLYSLMLEYYDGVSYDTLYYPNYINVVGHTNSILVNSSNICNNTYLDLTSQDSSVSEYFWSIDNVLSTQNSYNIDTVFSNNNQLHTITLTTLDTNNCSYSTSVGTVSTGIDPQFNFDATVCVGDSLIIQHNIPNNYQVEWVFETNVSSSVPNYIFTSAGIYEISAIVTDPSECELLFNLGQVEVSAANSAFTLNSLTNLCVGDTINATAIDSNCSVYNWSFNNVSMISDGANASGVVQSVGTYGITLETTTNGCYSTTSQNSIYTVNQAHADFVFSQDNLCVPVIAQFTDLSIAPVSWSWSFGDGSSSQLQHPSHNYLLTPQTQASLSIIDNNGCEASVTKNNIELFNVQVGISASTGCAPAAIVFSGNAQNAVEWNWSFGDGSSDTVQAPTHVYTMDGVYDVSLIATSADGCQDSAINPAALEIDRVVAGFLSSVNGACAPQPAYFTDSSYNAVAWQWDFGNGYTSTLQNPIQVYHTGGNYPVQLIAESSTGCRDTLYSTTPLSIMGPTADFSIMEAVVCAGEPISFVNNSQNASSFTWLFNNGNSSNDFSPSVEYMSSGIYNISLIASDTNGCQKIKTQAHQITLESLPDASFSISDTIGCNPLAISLSSNSLGSWFLNGNMVGSGSSNNLILNTGTHSIAMIAQTQNGCVDSTRINNIEVHPVYIPELSSLDPICQTQDTVVINTSLAMGSWFIDGVSNPSNQFDVSNLPSGDYTIIQEISTYCGGNDSVVLHIDSLTPVVMPSSLVVCESDNSFMLPSPSTLGYWSGSGIINAYSGLLDPGSTNLGVNMLSYTIINGSCLFMDSIELTVNEQPNATFSISNEVICEGNEMLLNYPENDSSALYNWSIIGSQDTINSSLLHPGITLEPGLWDVFLEVTNHGCSNSYSVSNVIVHDTIAPHTPSIIRSTVIDDDAVLTEWEEPSYGIEKISDFQIWRSADSIHFSLLNNVSSNQFSYVDYTTRVDIENYYYLIIPSNVCNVTAEKRNMSSSILLQREVIENDYLKFQWSKYYQWENGVDYYELQKQNKDGEWETIQKLDSTNYSTIIERP